jgi:hypothetical protein
LIFPEEVTVPLQGRSVTILLFTTFPLVPHVYSRSLRDDDDDDDDDVDDDTIIAATEYSRHNVAK